MKRHPFDIFSFVAGAIFVALGISFAATGDNVLRDADWIWPALLVALGVAGLAAALRRDDEPEDYSQGEGLRGTPPTSTS